MPNPSCPHCNGKTHSHGHRGVYPVYKCAECHKTFTDSTNTVGRPTIFDKPMTAAERKRRSRQKKKTLD